ncbi:MAG: IPTL-CTERM sorting domain-containing protein, partial [Xanthomonadales bacterium]|nr:IPTL-CTERM sorting domain-containing protein [Xanthomonadales bacterium]
FQMSAIEFAAPVQSKPVPVLTNWSLVLLAGLLGLFAFMVIRRKA